MNWPITSKQIELIIIIKNPSRTKKSPGPGGITGEVYQTFKGELTQIPLGLFPKIGGQRILPNSMRPALLWYQSQTRWETTQKLQIDIPYECRCKNPQQNTKTLNPTVYLNGYIPWPSGIYPGGNARAVQHRKINQCNTHCINRMKGNKQTDITS